MKILTNYKLLYAFGFLSIIAFLTLGIYLQYGKGIMPCPLCMLQRICLVFIGIFFLLGSILDLNVKGRYLLGISSLFFSICGIIFAGRQTWLQYFPPHKPDCGVSLEYLLKVLPIDQVVKKIFEGTADCSFVEWSFLNLSLAQWSLLGFIFLALYSVYQAWRIHVD